jgi:hypothetical protein
MGRETSSKKYITKGFIWKEGMKGQGEMLKAFHRNQEKKAGKGYV